MRRIYVLIAVAALLGVGPSVRPAAAAARAGAIQPPAATRPAEPAPAAPPPAAPPSAAPVPSTAAPLSGPGMLTVCGQQVPAPKTEPPAGSKPVVLYIAPCFQAQGGSSVVEPQTYLYYIRTRPSRPSEGVWVPYDEQEVLGDFQRLWNTHFLDNLWIGTEDYRFPNGTIGKIITYNMEERERVKVVDYTGTGAKRIDRSKIDDALKDAGITMQLDTFLDQGTIQKVEGVLRNLLHEKGFQAATVTHTITPMPGGPKLVHLTFDMDEGPKVRIRDVQFVGNKAISDGALQRQLKYNKPVWFLSFISGRGTYQESKFADDAERLVEYYRNKGYIEARVGDPQLKVLGDSTDKKTRWVELRIPVNEGERYRIGNFTFAGNTVIKSDVLRPLFKVKSGEYYDEKKVRKGLDDVRDLYGRGGYFEFTGYPDLHPRDGTEATPTADGDGGTEEAKPKPKPTGPPIVDVTMRLQEGKQYFVNRITFVGNTTTHDDVIRRQIRLFEGGVFNTEALKNSIKRLNQLGYFKKLEGEQDVTVTKTPDTTNKVDVKLKLQEQNRNQLTFGAGVSQFEGFFGQLGFTTSNFMGRGESLSLQAQAGSLAQNYSAAFTEPFLFDRNISGSIQVFKQDIQYLSQFTQESTGGNIGFGFPVADFTRMFLNYSYQTVRVSNINPVFLTPAVLAGNPYLQDTLLISEGGQRTVSKITPSIVHDTVDSPLFPTTGRRYTLSVDLAGIGGDTNFYKPFVEGVWYLKQSNRTSFGFRAQASYIAPFSGSAQTLPIFEMLFTGGEYSVRGFDIRTIGPRDSSGLVIGGNKLLLFNAEYLIQIAGPVRLVLFYDAGQVDAAGQDYAMNQFKTSTGAEIRFLMPVMNIPFRLIFAYNPQRSGVLNNSLLPQSAFTFHFAVGSTF
jgi:outer membrane protein insertion porin family